MNNRIASQSTNDVPTNGVVSILCFDQMQAQDLSLARLVEFTGLSYKNISLKDTPFSSAPLSSSPAKKDICLALSCDTLGLIQQDSRHVDEFNSLLNEKVSFLLVYGVSPKETSSNALRNLTDGVINGISSFPGNDYEYTVSTDDRAICQHFSGLSFGPINNEVDFGLDVAGSRDDIRSLVTINGKPLFIRIEKGNCSFFLLATSQLLDITRRLSGIPNATECFSMMVPIIMFLRYVFRERCWHNERDYASLIIDDPLLKRRYGFLNYDSLLEEMDTHNFFTNIAFIPWNYKRTSRYIADVMKERPDRFSICVHGCNHTNQEFGTTDSSELDRKIKLATKWITFHQDINRLPFDNVMIFPQGVFSTDSMRALKSNNYLAAVNSDVLPIDSPSSIEIRDLLEPAILNYYAFPLFYRRYPSTAMPFAFDLFFGKPALITAHHDYFRNGYEEIAELADNLNSLTKHLEWKGLSGIAEGSYLTRLQSKDIVGVKLYSRRATINNTSDENLTYMISKRETGETPIKSVTVNNEEVLYDLKDGILNIVTEAAPRNSINISIIYQETSLDTGKNLETYNKTKVYIRRHLSEIRDNYISKQSLLLALYNRLRRYI